MNINLGRTKKPMSAAQKAALAKAIAASAAKRRKHHPDLPNKPKRTAADYRAAGDKTIAARRAQNMTASVGLPGGKRNKRGNPVRTAADRAAGVLRGAGSKDPVGETLKSRIELRKKSIAKNVQKPSSTSSSNLPDPATMPVSHILRERKELIAKRNAGGLSKEETARLVAIQAESAQRHQNRKAGKGTGPTKIALGGDKTTDKMFEAHNASSSRDRKKQPKPTLKSKGTYDNRYNDPTDPTSGILGTEMRNGEWVPKPGYKRLNRYPGDPAYGPKPQPKPQPKQTLKSKGSSSRDNPIVPDSSNYAEIGSKLTDQRKSKWSADEKEMINSYTMGDFVDVNRTLQGATGILATSPERAARLRAAAQDFDKLFDSPNVKPTEDWMVVNRGTRGAFEIGIDKGLGDDLTLEDLQKQVGKTITNKGFISTSLGTDFSFPGTLNVRYKVPPGIRGLYVDGDGGKNRLGLAKYKGQREFILPRGLQYKVVSVKPSSGDKHKFDVEVEIVPPATGKSVANVESESRTTELNPNRATAGVRKAVGPNRGSR